jgi:hypothetical protein
MGYIKNAHKSTVGKFVRKVTPWTYEYSLRLKGCFGIVIIERGGKRGGINSCV